MSEPLKLLPAPELFFGLVAPIGVDLKLVGDTLAQLLIEMQYRVEELVLSELMKDVELDLQVRESPYIDRMKDKIAYANEIRKRYGDDTLARIAVAAVRSTREREWLKIAKARTIQDEHLPQEEKMAQSPLPKQAYVLRQLKRPEEIALLRSVYGRQFILVSAFATQEHRRKRIELEERRSRGGLASGEDLRDYAFRLLAQDANEDQESHGQKVRDAFPLGDVFIDASSRASCETTLRRFIHLLFGNNQISPSLDEYGMYMAKSASLRSSDLSRQVGAAIFSPLGEIITLGCNEVPKAGGGTYWSGDPSDKRDFVEGYDPNEVQKLELFVDILDRLKKGGHLAKELEEIDDGYKIANKLVVDPEIKNARLMDIIEFGRAIHAEMSAICDGARKGVSIANSTMYCTTFPCHICAKHIVTAGIRRLVFLEPYPKSYAFDLHADAIEVEGAGTKEKVLFQPFIGVSPFRYRDLFEKGRRKQPTGTAELWNKGIRRPMIEVYFPSYFEAEITVVADLKPIDPETDETSPSESVP